MPNTLERLGSEVAAAFLIAAAWACNSAKPERAPGQSAAVSSPVHARPVTGRSDRPPPLERWISALANGVDTTVTLGAWLAGHPSDTVSRRVPVGMDEEQFCRSAVTLDTASGRIWRRSGVFLIPPPPPGEALPDTSALAERLCRMRALWFESEETDSVQAEQSARELHGYFSRILGQPRAYDFLNQPGNSSWRGGASWIRGPRIVVVAANPGGWYPVETDTAYVHEPPSVVGLSYVGALYRMPKSPKIDPDELVEIARGDSAIGWAGVPGLVPLRRVLAHHRDSIRFSRGVPRPSPALDTVLLQALAALRDTVHLPPARRSAALFAMDVALHAHARELGRDHVATLLRQQLESLGARYEYYEPAGGYFYLRPFLWGAYQVDSLGPAGKSAFAELLERGWSEGFGCDDRLDTTGSVIGRGERALAAGLDDPMVHMAVAQAYADVYSLARVSVPQLAHDSARSRAERSEMARLRAIEHYRQVLSLVRDPGLRRTLWDRAVNLMLRRAIDTRYICEYH